MASVEHGNDGARRHRPASALARSTARGSFGRPPSGSPESSFLHGGRDAKAATLKAVPGRPRSASKALERSESASRPTPHKVTRQSSVNTPIIHSTRSAASSFCADSSTMSMPSSPEVLMRAHAPSWAPPVMPPPPMPNSAAQQDSSMMSAASSAASQAPESPSGSELGCKRAGAGGAGSTIGGGGAGSSVGTASSANRRTMGRRASREGPAGAPVRVVARIRPRLSSEIDEPEGLDVLADGRQLVLMNGTEQKQFALDQVFDSRRQAGSQVAFFDTFGRDMVQNAVTDHYNICVIAYGHTGSGKTYTMLGDGAMDNAAGEGLLPRFVRELFAANAMAIAGDEASEMLCSCEFYELYNDQIRDLLVPPGGESRTRQIHVHPKYGVRVNCLSTSVVTNAKEALDLVRFGNQMRSVASTTMNERSSRSHAFFTLKYEQRRAGETKFQSIMTFVDLAGRESRAASQNKAMQFREMCFINTSLFHLAHLIMKLSEGQVDMGSLSDFRNSKITMLLSQALVGNSRTAVVATVTPLKKYFEDSLSTMNFAAGVKKIRTRPVVNNKSPQNVVAELENEVRSLQRELAMSKMGNSEREQELHDAQALIEHYKRSWEDALTVSEQMRGLRKSMSTRYGLVASTIPRNADGSIVPFLTKLSDDTSLQGSCNYFLDKPILRIGSDCQACDIVLRGVGITPVMCEVRYVPGGAVAVALLDAHLDGAKDKVARIVVDGITLSRSKPIHVMKHADSLLLGYAHAFRLVKPSLETTADRDDSITPQCIVRRSISSLDVSSVVSELALGKQKTHMSVSDRILPFVSQISTRVTEEVARGFIRDLARIEPLVEEANVITAEVLGDADIRFELQALTNISDMKNDRPELVVLVLEKPTAVKTWRHGVRKVRRQLRRASCCSGSLDADSESEREPEAMVRRVASAPIDDCCIRDQDEAMLANCAPEKHPLSHKLGLDSHMIIGGRDFLLQTLTIEEFLCRLDAIREVYQDGCEANGGFTDVREKLASQPFQNPWLQPSFHDIKGLSEVAMPLLQGRMQGQTDHVQPLQPRMSPTKRFGRGTSLESTAPSSGVASPSFPSTSAEESLCDSGSEMSTAPTCAGSSMSSSSAAPSVTDYWRSLCNDMSSADVRLLAASDNGTPFSSSKPVLAHRLVLCRLPGFHRLLLKPCRHLAPGEQVEVVVPGASTETLRRIVRYAYTDDMDEVVRGLDLHAVPKLRTAAEALNVPDLVHLCDRVLSDDPLRSVAPKLGSKRSSRLGTVLPENTPTAEAQQSLSTLTEADALRNSCCRPPLGTRPVQEFPDFDAADSPPPREAGTSSSAPATPPSVVEQPSAADCMRRSLERLRIKSVCNTVSAAVEREIEQLRADVGRLCDSNAEQRIQRLRVELASSLEEELGGRLPTSPKPTTPRHLTEVEPSVETVDLPVGTSQACTVQQAAPSEWGRQRHTWAKGCIYLPPEALGAPGSERLPKAPGNGLVRGAATGIAGQMAHRRE